jgi:hypothetical protein
MEKISKIGPKFKIKFFDEKNIFHKTSTDLGM